MKNIWKNGIIGYISKALMPHRIGLPAMIYPEDFSMVNYSFWFSGYKHKINGSSCDYYDGINRSCLYGCDMGINTSKLVI